MPIESINAQSTLLICLIFTIKKGTFIDGLYADDSEIGYDIFIPKGAILDKPTNSVSYRDSKTAKCKNIMHVGKLFDFIFQRAIDEGCVDITHVSTLPNTQ